MSHLNSNFEKELQTLLRSSEESICDDTQQQLNQIKRNALAQEAIHTRTKRNHFWPAFSAVAASLVLAGILILPGSDQPFDVESYQEVSANSEEELYQNLDFYQWLADADLNGNG